MRKEAIMLGLIFLLCMMPMAFAEDEISAVTITLPSATASYVGGTYAFTGTYVGNSSGNITVYYNGTTLCADETVTAINGTFTCNADTSAITDGLYPNFNATAYNTTGSATADSTVWTIYFDNTDPVISELDTNSKLFTAGDKLSYTCTATDTQDASLTYSAVLTKPMNQGTVTRTTTTGDFSNVDTLEAGKYTLACTVTDDAGNTDVESLTVTFDEEGEISKITEARKEAENKDSQAVIFFVVIVVLVAIISVFFYINKEEAKKKRRSKKR